jgi:hypothetical protein
MDVGQLGSEVGVLMFGVLSRNARDVMAALLLGATLISTAACNPGQCLRQSDCPLGSACKKGMCKLPKPAPAPKDAGSKTSTTTSNDGTANQEVSSPSASNDAAALTDAASVSAQSSNLDSSSDMATTLTQ